MEIQQRILPFLAWAHSQSERVHPARQPRAIGVAWVNYTRLLHLASGSRSHAAGGRNAHALTPIDCGQDARAPGYAMKWHFSS
jgi:hypothetical protein